MAKKETAKEAATTVAERKQEQEREALAPASGRAFPESEANVLGVAGRGEAKPEEDDTLFGRIRRSGLVFNDDQVTGERWVGPSIQLEDVDAARKAKTIVKPLDIVGPQSGLVVRPAGLSGPSFTVPDGFGPNEAPDKWGAVTNPATGESLF